MEIGGELENAGKCVIYKTSICMEFICFIKYLGHSSDTAGYPLTYSFKKCSFSESIAMHKMEADFVFMKVGKADMNWKTTEPSCDRFCKEKLRGWWESIQGGKLFLTLDKGNLF